jgi:hypothetical protein
MGKRVTKKNSLISVFCLNTKNEVLEKLRIYRNNVQFQRIYNIYLHQFNIFKTALNK